MPRYADTHFTPTESHRLMFFLSAFKRFVIIANDDTIESVHVEESAGEVTVTEASRVCHL